MLEDFCDTISFGRSMQEYFIQIPPVMYKYIANTKYSTLGLFVYPLAFV
jgi:hypothetical protein